MTIDSGRWTTTKAALAVAGLLAISAVGSALAISPTVPAPIKWAGGAEFSQGPIVGGPYVFYTVPAGRNLILTDLVIGNVSGVAGSASISSGLDGGTCSSTVGRMLSIAVPPGGTTSVSLQTGIGFTAGTAMCIQMFTSALAVNGRGFLFTAAPPS